jgi:hypothetical protein
MLLASPATPSKVCHPKKPITCHAAVIVPEISALPESAEAVTPAPSVTPQQARVCIGGRSWLCKGQSLTQPVQKAETQRVCIGGRSWLCKGQTLTQPVQKVEPAQKQARVCIGGRSWLCKAQNLG